MAATPTTLASPASDPRHGETALAVALGGVICPVPFVMSAAALRIAGRGGPRRARAAHAIAIATIVVQTAALVLLALLLAR